MSTGIIFFVIGLVCGHTWPTAVGLAVALVSLIAIAATWYVDHSPDEVFDLFEDYCEKLIWYVVLPWAAGALLGAIWIASGV